MPRRDVLSIIIFFIALIGAAIPLGTYLSRILQADIPVKLRWLKSIEHIFYKLCGINPSREQKAREYLKELFLFNFLGFIFLMAILMLQGFLPLNPARYSGLSWDLAFNTAVSFVTNTNWQAYSGEAALSNFSQALGLTSQNFLSATTGISLVAVLARGLTHKQNGTVGNFGVDLIRCVVYLLLPLSLLWAIVLVSQGVVQSFADFPWMLSLEGSKQQIPLGPAASQIAIKQLGTNGGGFFGTNSAHPFENPTPFSNFVELVAILLIPVAQVFAFGKMLKRPKEGVALLVTMLLIFIPLLALALWSEHAWGIMEGKEVRLGITDSVLWAVSTTAASNGSVNAMHSSFTPLSGFVMLFQMITGEVVFGGAGSGLYGIALYAIVTLFLAGLMVGRSPEWMGKKIEAYEVKLALLALLVPGALILMGTSLGLVSDWGRSALMHDGPHGFSELFYGFSSTAGNNGSAFGGLSANTPVLNVLFGICMLVGRFIVIVPVVLISSSLGKKKITPPGPGSFPTDGYLFAFLLAGLIVIFGALTFFPAIALGPVAEHLLMVEGI